MGTSIEKSSDNLHSLIIFLFLAVSAFSLYWLADPETAVFPPGITADGFCPATVADIIKNSSMEIYLIIRCKYRNNEAGAAGK